MEPTTTAHPVAQRTRWAPVVALALAMLVVTSELTMAAVTLPGLGRDLRMDAGSTACVLLAYALPMAATAIPIGRWADRADVRAAFLLAMAGVGVTSVLTALAPTVWMLLAGRLLQGLAAAFIVAAYLPVVTGSVRPEQRGRAIGFIVTIMTLGGMAGAPIGGLVAGSLGWRGVFLIKIPLLVVVLWLGYRSMPSNGRGLPRPGGALVREALLLGGAVAGVLLAVQELDDRPAVAAAITVAAIALAVWWARLPASRPVLALLREREYGTVVVSVLTTSFLIGLTAFLLPWFVADVLHGSPELTGLALLFFVGAIAPVSFVAGALVDRFGAGVVARAGSVVAIAGLLSLVWLGPDARLADLAWRLAVVGIGAGLYNPAINAAGLAATPSGMEGASGGVTMTARNVATTVGPAVAALCWTLAGGGAVGFRTGIVVVVAFAVAGLLALLVPARQPAR